MSYDLVIFPEDWFLRIWWGEFAPGTADLMPKGGHWMLLIRMATAKDGENLPRWIREEVVREHGQTEWKKTISLTSEPVLAQIEFGQERRRVLTEFTNAETGRIHIGGGGGVLRYMLEHGVWLPVWMRLLIIEHRAASANTAST